MFLSSCVLIYSTEMSIHMSIYVGVYLHTNSSFLCFSPLSCFLRSNSGPRLSSAPRRPELRPPAPPPPHSPPSLPPPTPSPPPRPPPFFASFALLRSLVRGSGGAGLQRRRPRFNGLLRGAGRADRGAAAAPGAGGRDPGALGSKLGPPARWPFSPSFLVGRETRFVTPFWLGGFRTLLK